MPDCELARAAAAGCARPVRSGLVDGRAGGAQFVCLSARQQNCPAHDAQRSKREFRVRIWIRKRQENADHEMDLKPVSVSERNPNGRMQGGADVETSGKQRGEGYQDTNRSLQYEGSWKGFCFQLAAACSACFDKVPRRGVEQIKHQEALAH
ncbi:hypothetical protein EYF80_023723 [Liparis tanakae]|uniref:Uncharacterized protein n=1 Tax=Liparis tanakae TaxID=230148 RepID=A0A4Z2HLB6_9TELE|nr:hypothetical protein EYF80_023723 [Liparis tanakae]